MDLYIEVLYLSKKNGDAQIFIKSHAYKQAKFGV
ncbi:hypothetical protein ACSSV5_002398 [Psychroflexus sp. MBR-150]|jgi:hypothetical protein